MCQPNDVRNKNDHDHNHKNCTKEPRLAIATFRIATSAAAPLSLAVPHDKGCPLTRMLKTCFGMMFLGNDDEKKDAFIDVSVGSALKLKKESKIARQYDTRSSAAYMALAQLARARRVRGGDTSLLLKPLKFTCVHDLSSCVVLHRSRSMMKHDDECVLLKVSSNIPTRMIRATWRLSQYKLHALLHNGYASTVFSGRCMVSSMDVVIKQYELHRLSKRERYHLFREMSIHSQLMHENIVQFYTAFVVKTNAYIVMQKCNGLTLRQIMVRCVPSFTEKDAVECVIRPLVSALIYMHSMGIVHRDIKPENVVIGMNESATCLKLLDFGLANDLTSFQARSSAGTMQYMAPELFFSNKANVMHVDSVDNKSYTLATDVWALGVMVYEMLHGIRPFRHSIGHTHVTYSPSISLAARDFINHALNANHDRRPPIAWFKEHAWLA